MGSLDLIMPGSAVPGGWGGGAPPWFELVIRPNNARFGGSRRFELSLSLKMPGSAVPGGWGGGAPPWFELVIRLNNWLSNAGLAMLAGQCWPGNADPAMPH